MTNVTFPRSEIEKHIKLTKETIEKISLFGTPLESLTSDSLEIEVFPNRPDLISMQGFLRGFKTFLNPPRTPKTYTLKKPLPNYKVKVDPSVKEIRPFTACAIVKDLFFDNQKIKEIIDLQEKLHITIGRNRKKVAIGIYPLEKIKLPIHYKALPPKEIKFQPLESDREMTAQQILTRHPAGKTYAHILENLDKYPIFQDANKQILSMPPIINSKSTGRITSETKEIFVECSGHDLSVLQKNPQHNNHNISRSRRNNLSNGYRTKFKKNPNSRSNSGKNKGLPRKYKQTPRPRSKRIRPLQAPSQDGPFLFKQNNLHSRLAYRHSPRSRHRRRCCNSLWLQQLNS